MTPFFSRTESWSSPGPGWRHSSWSVEAFLRGTSLDTMWTMVRKPLAPGDEERWEACLSKDVQRGAWVVGRFVCCAVRLWWPLGELPPNDSRVKDSLSAHVSGEVRASLAWLEERYEAMLVRCRRELLEHVRLSPWEAGQAYWRVQVPAFLTLVHSFSGSEEVLKAGERLFGAFGEEQARWFEARHVAFLVELAERGSMRMEVVARRHRALLRPYLEELLVRYFMQRVQALQGGDELFLLLVLLLDTGVLYEREGREVPQERDFFPILRLGLRLLDERGLLEFGGSVSSKNRVQQAFWEEIRRRYSREELLALWPRWLAGEEGGSVRRMALLGLPDLRGEVLVSVVQEAFARSKGEAAEGLLREISWLEEEGPAFEPVFVAALQGGLSAEAEFSAIGGLLRVGTRHAVLPLRRYSKRGRKQNRTFAKQALQVIQTRIGKADEGRLSVVEADDTGRLSVAETDTSGAVTLTPGGEEE